MGTGAVSVMRGSQDPRRLDGQPVAFLVIRDGRHPWVLALLVGIIMAGLHGLLTPPDLSVPLDRYLPPNWRFGYYGLMAAAGAITLVGVWLSNLRDRLMVEQIGLWFLMAPLLLYPIALFTLYNGVLGVGSIISSMLGIGGLFRIWNINKELRSWHRRSDRTAE